MPLLFEWDPAKGRSNIAKHGVAFDEASTCSEDALSITIPDPVHSQEEERFVLIGHSHRNRILVIVHTDRGERIQIISARPATDKERRFHEKDAD